MEWTIALLLKPLAIGLLVACVLMPARRYAESNMKEGKLKRLLLHRIS